MRRAAAISDIALEGRRNGLQVTMGYRSMWGWKQGHHNGYQECCPRFAVSGGRLRPMLSQRTTVSSWTTVVGRPLERDVRLHGSGTSKSRQIFFARYSLISRCRGTDEVFLADRLT